MKMKVVLLIMFITILFCGCSAREEHNEIEDLAFVSNIGIDKIPDEKGVLVSVRITDYGVITTAGMSGGESSKGFHVMSAKGESFYSAIKALQLNSPQTLFFGHNKSIVLGKDFAEGGLTEIIDGLERNSEITGSNKIFVSEDSAKDALNKTFDSITGSRTDFINAMLDALKDNSIIAPVILYKFTLELKSDNKTSYAPVVSFIASQNKEEDSQDAVEDQAKINLENTAIFKDNKLITILPKKETANFLWMKDEMKAYTIIVPVNRDGILTLEIKNGKTKISPEMTDEGLIVKINCKGEAYLHQVSEGVEIIDNKESITKIEQLIEDQLERELQDSISYAKNQIKCDYFGIAHVIHNKLPDYWKDVSKQWDKIFQITPFLVTFNIELKDIGMINEPGTAIMEEGEVK